jgi:hypothetical protein
MLQNTPQPGSYFDLKTRMRKKMQPEINQKILAIFAETYEKTLNAENIVLSRPEKQRLFEQLLPEILTELMAKNK